MVVGIIEFLSSLYDNQILLTEHKLESMQHSEQEVQNW